MEVTTVIENQVVHSKDYHQLLNEIEAQLFTDPIELQVRHIFTPGLYARELFIPAGVVLTSYVHKFTHPFVVSSGVINILDNDLNVLQVVAPFTGVSLKGTRRTGMAINDCTWTTFHPTAICPVNNSKEAFDDAVGRVEKELFEVYENPLLHKKLEDKK